MKEELTPPSDSQVSQATQCSPSGLYPPEQEQDDSDNPWKLALESSGEGVWDWNVVTGEQTHSRQWKEMLGYAEHEVGTGYHEFTDRVHPDDIARVQAAATAYMEGRAPAYSADLRLRCKDGSWKWILTRGMVVSRDARGRPLRMIGTHTDITERKQTEETLRELNLRLIEQTGLMQTTLASISQGIFMLDATGRVSTFNPRVCELLDMPESFLANHPTTQEMTIYQLERGDFGPDAQLMDPKTRSYVMSVAQGTPGVLPSHYLRLTPAGRTLEVKTQILPDGSMVRTFADVTDYVQAETARKQLNLLLDATQAIARVGGWDADIANDRIFWTAGIYRLLETSAEQYTPTTATASQFFTPQARALIKASYGDGIDQPEGHDLELEMVTARGRRIWVHSMGTTTWEQGKPVRRTAVLQDITERKQNEAALRENEERWKLALESTGDGVWDWYVQTGEEFFSRRLKEMYGFGEHEMPDLASELDARTHPEDVANMHKDRQAHFDGLTPTYINEHRVRCRDGNWKWVLARGMVISRDAQGRPLRMIGTHTDITDRKRSEALVWQQAHFDALTGLPNRNMLRDRLEQEIKKSRRDGLQLACLFIDLDHFKEVNDTLGHDTGDLLLIEAARRIRDCVRASDTVARMGGDEFTVILTEVTDAASIESILQKILQALEAVFELGDERVFVSASIGITMYPLDATEIEGLFKNADQALYVAKGAGRNRFSFFTPALQEAAQMRVRLANDLRGGLIHQQFRVVYQPIVELATGAVHKAEALIRWHHPTRGLVSPADFIPIAEASGLIVDIGDWVFQQAAHQVKAWRAALDCDFQISVNKSPVQFHERGGSHAPWDRQLQAMGLPGESIVVEITEGLLLDTSSSVADQLLELRDAGIQVSLDDFGTGYSSLSYLQKFDIDFIKIDQSFVRHLIADSTDLALCKAIIVMAHALGIKVIAEGVETPLQRDLLVAAGCDYAQGYLFSRPIPAPDFEAFMASKGRSGR
ncbi:MAG: EAL domain-containing protein [Rhodoferax sp.]|uniref:sensor domain-containing protein n=1 Tax=Rhodoferax sp. TaxID=50421 RepID=UPI00271FA925|nr:EAL domain-containing protein [Rhodoferax sp.]MDO8449902.1 EAL domain-containing protein [Rhodoferax sp.]